MVTDGATVRRIVVGFCPKGRHTGMYGDARHPDPLAALAAPVPAALGRRRAGRADGGLRPDPPSRPRPPPGARLPGRGAPGRGRGLPTGPGGGIAAVGPGRRGGGGHRRRAALGRPGRDRDGHRGVVGPGPRQTRAGDAPGPPPADRRPGVGYRPGGLARRRCHRRRRCPGLAGPGLPGRRPSDVRLHRPRWRGVHPGGRSTPTRAAREAVVPGGLRPDPVRLADLPSRPGGGGCRPRTPPPSSAPESRTFPPASR
jgi:hypothetical protein